MDNVTDPFVKKMQEGLRPHEHEVEVEALRTRIEELEAAIYKHVERECKKCPSHVEDLNFCPSTGCSFYVLWSVAKALKGK